MVAAPAGQGQPPALHKPGRRLRRAGGELAAALAAAALYLPCLGFPFVFDDHALIDASGFPVPLGGSLPYRPVRYLSYRLDAALGGSPVVYHLHSVVLFALLVALVVRLSRRLGATLAAALAGALLVAVHPLAVEATAYVAGRRDLLGVACGLAAVLFWIGGRSVVALLLLLAGIGAKESALVAAAAMLLASLGGVAPGRRRDYWLLAAAAATGVALALAYGAVGPWLPGFDVAGLLLPGRVAIHYGWHLLQPLVERSTGLCVEYPDLRLFVERVRSGEVALPSLLACGAATLAVAGAVAASLVSLLRHRPAAHEATGPDAALRFVVAWAAVCLAAVTTWGGLHEPGADRHALLAIPVAGVALALAVDRLGRGGRGPALAAVFAAVVALVPTTLAQQRTWASEKALWTHAVAVEPRAPRARLNLAGLLAAEGRYNRAARHLARALREEPRFAAAYLGRAVVRCARHRPLAARGDLARALSLGADRESVEGIGRDCPLPEFQDVSSPAQAPAGAPFPPSPQRAASGREPRA